MKENRLKYSEEEIKKWGEFYKNGNSLKQTAEKFNINYSTVKQNLLRFGYRKPCRSVSSNFINEINYFHKIDSEEKAYFLGFLYSDGYICKTPYGYSTGIALQKEDEYIIQAFKQKLGITGNVSYYKNSAKISSPSKNLYLDLQNIGIQEDKSHKDFHTPNIDSKYINAFIRGYFDGDGCITIKSTGYSVVSICCNSKIFLEDIKAILEQNNIKCRPICTEKRNKNLYVLYLSKRENQIKFCNYIYSNANLYLKRKYLKFMQIPR